MASSSRSRATASMRSTVASCLSILSIAAAAVIGVDGAPAFGSSKLLVVLDAKDSPREHYSSFWNSLEARGFELTFRDARDASPQQEQLLTRYEQKQYDGLVLFAPSVKSLPGDLSPQAIFSFMTNVASPQDAAGNVLIALSSSLSESYRDFAREFSIEFDERDTTLYDPKTASAASPYTVDVPADYTFTPSPGLENHANIVSAETRASGLPIRYSGPVHQATDIPLLVPLLRAPPQSFPIEVTSSSSEQGATINVVEGGPLVAGEAAKLVSAFQTRVNSRAIWSGSTRMFSDEFWTPETSNEAFVRDVTRWLFNEKGILRVLSSRHYATNDASKEMREQYRIGEDMTYEIVLSAYEDDRWIAPSTLLDLQLEVTMLDPHLRIPLLPSTDISHRSTTNRTYLAHMKLPDRHGVFTLLTDYKRQGVSFIEDRRQMSITPLRHDEYPRFIRGAYPYYVTAASMMAAWLAFAWIWLTLSKDKSVLDKQGASSSIAVKQAKGVKIQ